MSKAISWARAHLGGDTEGAAGELCLAAMIAGASADGFDAAERAYVIATARQLPGFEGRDAPELDALVDRVLASLAGADVGAVVGALAERATAAQKQAAYSLACLATLSDGAATDDELDRLLEIRDALGLTDSEAADLEAIAREGAGAHEVFEEDGVAWRLAIPEIRDRAVRWAIEALDPTPLAPYADACVEVMLLAAAADGALDATEADQLHELAERLPVLGGIDALELERFVADAAARIAREGADRRLEAIAAWLPPEARRGAFLLGVVVSLADHRMTDGERLFVERMRDRFGLSPAEGEELVAAVRDEVYG